MIIGVLPPPLFSAILDNLTIFAQNQLTHHHNRFPTNSSAKFPTLMTVYYDKIENEPLLNHTILAIGMLKDTKFYKLYTQTWVNVTFALLQGPKNIQIIIDALIYDHVSHCLSTRDILSPDKPIKSPYHQTLSRILLIDHNFTTNISSPPSPTISPASPEITRVLIIAVISMSDTPTLVVPPNPKIPTVTPINF